MCLRCQVQQTKRAILGMNQQPPPKCLGHCSSPTIPPPRSLPLTLISPAPAVTAPAASPHRSWHCIRSVSIPRRLHWWHPGPAMHQHHLRPHQPVITKWPISRGPLRGSSRPLIRVLVARAPT